MLKKFRKPIPPRKIGANEYKKTLQDPTTLTNSLEKNIVLFKEIFSDDETLIVRRFQNKYLSSAKCCLIYLDGMVNTEILNENIIQPVLATKLHEDLLETNLLEELQSKVIASNNVKVYSNIDKIVSSVIYGDTLFLLEGYQEALIIETKGWQTRGVNEPESAKVVRGPREGFTESIMINLTLVRRKINNPDLKFKFKDMGERTKTKTSICYIEGLASTEILTELEQRLDKINVDSILDSGYIQELIRDAPFSPYETVGYFERPDVIAAKLLEGRIAIFVDGSPFVLTVPYVLAESTQANEDYYNNFLFASINRLMRTSATFLSYSIPSLYLAVVTYHQEMLPTPLLLSVASSRQGVPFPTAMSLFIMLFVFDVLREAGTRMPTPVGQAVNIVGALVLGQAVVEAKLVSAPVIIITAFSGILTLMNMTLIGPTILIRSFLLLATTVLGIYGYVFGMLIVILHLMNIRSFGVPYMLNVSAIGGQDAKDVWIRSPWWSMLLRPKIIGAKDRVRQSTKKNKEN